MLLARALACHPHYVQKSPIRRGPLGASKVSFGDKSCYRSLLGSRHPITSHPGVFMVGLLEQSCTSQPLQSPSVLSFPVCKMGLVATASQVEKR